MYVERDLFGARRPVLIAKAIDMFAVILRVKGVITGGNTSIVDDVGIRWVDNLPSIVSSISTPISQLQIYK